ncbi:MAG TPA: FixH family protein [Polyangiaceae bacterium]|jgi:hypothetical protein
MKNHPFLTLVRSSLLVLPVALVVAASACGGDDTSGNVSPEAGFTGAGGGDGGGVCLSDGGPASGPADMHCVDDGGMPILGEATECPTTALADDAGMEPLPGGHPGTEADDDDCKYHVQYSVSCVTVGQPVTFTVTLTSKADGTPVTGANPKTVEGFLGNTHILPNTPMPTATEGSPGVYTIGPVVFDASGEWTVRFHFFETCTDTETSKHGHAAFLIDVP